MKQILALFCLWLAAFNPAARAAVILQYHHIDTATPSLTSTSPELFAEHLAYLHEHNFQVIPLDEMLERVLSGDDLPSKVVAITFDDGYSSVAEYAAPVLERYEFPYAIFVNPDLIGNSSDFLSWSQLEDLQSRGALVANHTLDHPHLVRREADESSAQWEARIRQQIEEAEHQIEDNLGESHRFLAYPYGEYDRAVERILEDLGFIGLAQQSGAFDARVDQQAIPRYAFGGSYGGMDDFITKVNTLPLPWTAVSTRDEGGDALDDPLLPAGVARPQLLIELESPQLAQQINCYASGQGALAMERDGNTVRTRPNADLPVGRSRINCTAPSSDSGRFYWYSEFFMRRNPDGSWYEEY